MKSTCVATKTATGLLLIALVGQVGALKVAKQPVAVVDVNPPPPPPPPPSYAHQQEEAIQREQLQQQQQFELLQQQQRQAELQIQHQQLEAQRLIGRPLPMFQQQRHEYAGGVKGASAPPRPPPQPQQLPPFADAYDQYQPQRPAIAYLVVRPPYQLPMPYDESAYRVRYQQPALTRPFGFPNDYPRLSQPEPVYAAGTKGGRQGLQDPPTPPPPQQQPPPPPPPPQPALVVPVQGDKHGKLRAMLDKIISKLSFSSYEVAGEEYVYPTLCANCQTKQELPVQQQLPVEQQQIQQIREEEDLTQLQQQPLQQQPIQQQQTLIEQVDKDQGFDEPPKSAPQKLAEPTKQEPLKLEEFSQQQQLTSQEQEPEFARQPQSPKGGAPQPPTRQPEPVVQQQHLEDSAKGTPKMYSQQQLYFPQQQQQQQQEPLRSEQKVGF